MAGASGTSIGCCCAKVSSLLGCDRVMVLDEECLVTKVATIAAAVAAAKSATTTVPLVVIADFDRTLTAKYYYDNNGKRQAGSSTFGAIENCSYVSEDYRTQCRKMLEHYIPIELDPHIPIDEKTAAMKKWWADAYALLAAQGLRKEYLSSIGTTALVQFREGCLEFFKFLEEQNIPLFIFSAGVTDVIEALLRAKLGIELPRNAHIISNKAIWNDEGVLVGFQDPVIHSLNKNCFRVLESHLPPELVSTGVACPNPTTPFHTLLLGDTLGDACMSQCLATTSLSTSVVVRLCFLSDDAEQHAKQYGAAFDVLVTGDGPITVAMNIVKHILKV
ncbi:7-methylguanosine phosphate-specific 5'-nucleotidase A [Pelomyxa schiedti]|nr:7-methylguanosine phosphate-specific 5'-nucleotidase A [Pelomyxa schiedti]